MGLSFIFAYLLGGLTLLPLLLCVVLLYAHLTLPRIAPESSSSSHDNLRDTQDDDANIKSGNSAVAQKFRRIQESDVAEGYFAVCREYVPGGINGKPPERTTPAGEVVAEESPSVYQSMYRSIFDRKQTPTLEASKSNGKSSKRARNVFYVVLRHGHLMLYDDAEQVEVRHVISLAHHDVSVFGGGNEIPEGELWIKRNSICLKRKIPTGDATAISKPFYFFSENCSDKEDFYFALLQNQERNGDDPLAPPTAQRFDAKHVIALVQRLHSSEENMQTRWINAMVGRLFLALYKTSELENFVRAKVTKKIARVKKPTFLSGIILQHIDLGDSAPLITNPRLKDLTIHGDCCVEADLFYDGNFRLEIAATARIDLGTRFKAREVNLVLAAVLKKLEGHILVRFKPPPSNRIWVTFETMPHMEMSIEPVVSSRQITYSIILRAIESRIREVVAETLVLPHWDDSPFASSLGQQFRGGLWQDDQTDLEAESSTAILDDVPEDQTEADALADSADLPHTKDDRSLSMPAMVETEALPSSRRRGHQSAQSLDESDDSGITSGMQKFAEMPKSIRSRSFAPIADPVLNMANIDAGKDDGKSKRPKDAASSMMEISNRSQPSSPVQMPVSSRPHSLLKSRQSGSFSSTSSRNSVTSLSASRATITSAIEPSHPPSPTHSSSKSTNSSLDPSSQASNTLPALKRSLAASVEKRQVLPAIGAAAAAAKKWGWNAYNRSAQQNRSGRQESPDPDGTPDRPIGRGHPLPPPGQPLPRPPRAPILSKTFPRRKAVPPSVLPVRADHNDQQGLDSVPALPLRHDPLTNTAVNTSNILVVEAPNESDNEGPSDDAYGDFQDNFQDDEDEDHGTDPAAAKSLVEVTLTSTGNALDEELHQSGRHRYTASLDDDDNHVSSWRAAQEEEARSKSVWIDDREEL